MGGEKLCRQHHLSWVAKPTEKTAVVATPTALPSFMPDALPVATFPIYPGLVLAQGNAGYSPTDIGSPSLHCFDAVNWGTGRVSSL